MMMRDDGRVAIQWLELISICGGASLKLDEARLLMRCRTRVPQEMAKVHAFSGDNFGAGEADEKCLCRLRYK